MQSEKIICRLTGEPFDVFDRERELLLRSGLPLPTISPIERHRRRLAYRNERKLFKNTCAISGQPLISLYHPESGFKPISAVVWWSDNWDPRAFGREVDFTRPFFPQLYELKMNCPRLTLLNTRGENSDYCNNTTDNRNCYLVFGGDYNQDCMYSIYCMHSRDVSDVFWVYNGELVFDCINCNDCYDLRYSQDCNNCRDSSFLFECRNCSNCCCSTGLVGARFHFFNQPLSEEEYRRQVAALGLETRSGVEATRLKFEGFLFDQPHREANIVNCENSAGDHLLECKNCLDCFDITGPAEDLFHTYLAGWGAKDLVSCSTCGHRAELYFECMGCIDGTNCAFSTYAWSSRDIYYSDGVTGCSNLFGCSNMRRAEYCILNKQYSAEQFFELRAKLIAHMKETGEWGEFPAIEYSPFPYNLTVAQDHFPLSKSEALSRGYRWHDEDLRDPSQATALPDSIDDAADRIVDQTLICRRTGRPYKIIPKELALYRRLRIPLPDLAPETRNESRLKRRHTLFQYPRICSGCGKSIFTVWREDLAESVLCQECYLRSVY